MLIDTLYIKITKYYMTNSIPSILYVVGKLV